MAVNTTSYVRSPLERTEQDTENRRVDRKTIGICKLFFVATSAREVGCSLISTEIGMTRRQDARIGSKILMNISTGWMDVS